MLLVLPMLPFWVLLVLLLVLLGNLCVFRSLQPAPPPANPPLVSILIPARNETLNIERCVGSLLQQDYPNFELLVLDDHSTDDTAERVTRLFRGPTKAVRTLLLTGAGLPPGWTGKNWGCHQLGSQAKGEYLFFTDADTFHRPGTISAALRFATTHRADLLSAWPRMVTVTLGEKLIVPVIMIVGLVMWPQWAFLFLQRYPRLAKRCSRHILRTLAGANGQFLFFRRAGYDAIGGHEAVRDFVAEDVALGRAMAAKTGEGWRLWNCDALDFSEVRMYRSFRESWFGFAKNVRGIFEKREIVFWLFLLCLWSCFLAPCLALLWASPAARPRIVAELALLAAIRLIMTVRLRSTWIGALLHPLGIAIFMGIALHSAWLSRRGVVPWKGRSYRPEI